MSAKIVGVLLAIGLIYGLMQLPDYYRKQGYDQGVKDVQASIKQAVDAAKHDNEVANAKIALANEIKFRNINHEYKINIEKLESDYQHKLATGLLFNKNGICASQVGTTSKGESIDRTNEGNSGTRTLPEPYSTNIIELMHEADRISENLKALQEVVKKSSCMVVVSEDKE